MRPALGLSSVPVRQTEYRRIKGRQRKYYWSRFKSIAPAAEMKTPPVLWPVEFLLIEIQVIGLTLFGSRFVAKNRAITLPAEDGGCVFLARNLLIATIVCACSCLNATVV
jgi:hypothetical protein